MIVDLVKIEEEVMKIWDKSIECQDGKAFKNIVDNYVNKTGLEIVGVQVAKEKSSGFINKQDERIVNILLEQVG